MASRTKFLTVPRWTSGSSIDGRGEFTVFQNKPLGEEPVLGAARPDSGAQDKQIG